MKKKWMNYIRNILCIGMFVSLAESMCLAQNNTPADESSSVEPNLETGENEKILFDRVSATRSIVPLSKADDPTAGNILKGKPASYIMNLPKGNQTSLKSAQASMEAIMRFVLTYQMPELKPNEMEAGLYAGLVIPLPALLQKKDKRISLEEMKENNLMENPVLIGINDVMGRPWTYKQVINSKEKACKEREQYDAISKYILTDYDYPFLVITRQGPLSVEERNLAQTIIKKEIAEAMEETLKAAEENIQKTNLYNDQTINIKQEIDELNEQVKKICLSIRENSLLFKSGVKLPKSIAQEKIVELTATPQN